MGGLTTVLTQIHLAPVQEQGVGGGNPFETPENVSTEFDIQLAIEIDHYHRHTVYILVLQYLYAKKPG
jgi:hypothetical protein